MTIIETHASELAESWINGNRTYVVDALLRAETSRELAVSLAALIVLELPKADARLLVHRLALRYEDTLTS